MVTVGEAKKIGVENIRASFRRRHTRLMQVGKSQILITEGAEEGEENKIGKRHKIGKEHKIRKGTKLKRFINLVIPGGMSN